jgi:MFS family permease
MSITKRHYPLILLAVANFFFYADRYILFILAEPIKKEFSLTDGEVGLLTGVAFAITYCLFAIPLGRRADHGARVPMLAVASLAWSCATALFGFAQTFVQLLVLRSFVAIGEGAGYVTIQSMIGDLYKPEQRAKALAIVFGAGNVGMIFAYAVVGTLSDSFGWRAGFIGLGLIGIVLAPVIYFTLKEPKRGEAEGLAIEQVHIPFSMAASQLWSRKSFVFMVAGYIAAAITSFSVLAWLPAFLMRRFDLSVSTTGIVTSVGAIGPMLLGMMVAGMVSNYLYQRDPKWVIRLPVIGMLLGAIFLILQVTTPNLTLAILYGAVPAFISGIYIPPLMAAMQNISGNRLRGTAAAITAFATMLMGQGVGPALVGALSDLFNTGELAGTYQPLQQAILAVSGFYLVTAILLAISIRYFTADLQSARDFDERGGMLAE